MLAGFIGFGSFFLAVLIIAIIGYWRADELEAWTKKLAAKRKNHSLSQGPEDD